MKASHIVVLLVSFLVSDLQAGIYFESTTTVTGGKPGQSSLMNSKARSFISDDKLRTEMIESQNPMMPAGSFMISTDGGKTMTIVNPATQSYAIMDLEAMAGMFSGGMVNIVNPAFEKIADEDGGEILGHKVRHIKFKKSYGMEMNFMGMRNSTTVESTQEIWAASDLLADGPNLWSGQKGFATGDKEFDRRILDEMAKIRGLPLKQVMTSRETADGGAVTESVTTINVNLLREEHVEDSMFEIPSGFTERSIIEIGASQRMNSDTSDSGDQAPAFDPSALMEMMNKMKRSQP